MTMPEERHQLKEVIVLRGVSDKLDYGEIEEAQKLATASGCLVVTLDEGVTLETLSEDDMLQAGWIRAAEPEDG
jgi:hypothetical protein